MNKEHIITRRITSESYLYK